MVVYSNKDVGEAIKKEADTIEMSRESEAGKTVYKIKVTGNVAWGVCFAALAVAIVAIIVIPVTGGASAIPAGAAGFIGTPIVVGVLGGPAAAGAIVIAVAGGGAGILNKLRGYKMEEKNGKIILTKK
jgi:hypothetical protein